MMICGIAQSRRELKLSSNKGNGDGSHIKEAGVQYHTAVYGLKPTRENEKGLPQEIVEGDSHRGTSED